MARYQQPNTPPALASFPKAGLEDQVLTFTAADFTTHFTDADGDPLVKLKVTTLPANGVLKLNSTPVTLNQEILASDLGGLSFTPDADYFGAASFNWNASDPITYAGAGATVNVSLAPVNDAPSFTKGADQAVLKDTGAHTLPGWATASVAGPLNESTQTLTFTVTNDNHPLFSAQPALAADGSLTFTPAPNATGTASLSVSLMDSGGTLNGGVDTSALQTFKILIAADQLYLPVLMR